MHQRSRAGGRITAIRAAMGKSSATRVASARKLVSLLKLALLSAAISNAIIGIAQATPTHPFLAQSSLNGTGTDPGPNHPPQGGFNDPCGATVDSQGYIYVTSHNDGVIDIFNPQAEYLTQVSDPDGPCDLAVDSEGHLYVESSTSGDVAEYTPSTYPPTSLTTYGSPSTIDSSGAATAIAVDPSTNRLYVDQGTRVVEYDALANGSMVLDSQIASGWLSESEGVDVDAETGDVYVSDTHNFQGTVEIFNPDGSSGPLVSINGSNVPYIVHGGFLSVGRLAVDQSDGDVYVSNLTQSGAVDEFDSAGNFISQIEHSFEDSRPTDIAVDNSGKPSAGDVFITSGGGSGGSLFAFDAIVVHAPTPSVRTGQASGLEPSATTLNGSVNPNGDQVSECYFEYVEESSYQASGYASAKQAPCTSPTAKSVGAGSIAVAVHAELKSLIPGLTYHFRLVAYNSNGIAQSEDQIFTMLILSPAVSSPIAIDIGPTGATLEGAVNPENLHTTYRFAYGTANSYGQSAPLPEANAGAGTSTDAVSERITGLRPNTTYHFALLATNAHGTSQSPDQDFGTVPAPPAVLPLPASALGSNTATLNGTVDPYGLKSTCKFNYGTGAFFYSATVPCSPAEVGTGSSAVPIHAELSDLLPETTYHFNIVATSSQGTTASSDQSFLTLTSGRLAPRFGKCKKSFRRVKRHDRARCVRVHHPDHHRRR
jgi:hypothetical protein